MPRWASLFFPADQKKILSTHYGWDKGAIDVAQIISKNLNAQLFEASYSRLLIDINRSLQAKKLWSSWSQSLPEEIKRKILKEVYHHFRDQVKTYVSQVLKKEKKIGVIAVHSFTPIWKEKNRRTDLGLLYDPANKGDENWAKSLKPELQKQLPNWKIHLNLPYRGHTDCFLNDLVEEFSNRKNLIFSVFLEINQKKLVTSLQRKKIGKVLSQTLESFK